ncbi:hypothetical protein ES705_21975 [subsurface metagenome]
METLKNGAHILLRGENSHQDGFVLAITDRDFSTWAIDQEGNTFWGHYYSLTLAGLIEVTRDYRQRIGYHEDGTPIEEVKQP